MTDEYTDFWWALFKCGDTEDERRMNWNGYIHFL